MKNTIGIMTYKNIMSGEIVYGPLKPPTAIDGKRFVYVWGKNTESFPENKMLAENLSALKYTEESMAFGNRQKVPSIVFLEECLRRFGLETKRRTSK